MQMKLSQPQVWVSLLFFLGKDHTRDLLWPDRCSRPSPFINRLSVGKGQPRKPGWKAMLVRSPCQVCRAVWGPRRGTEKNCLGPTVPATGPHNLCLTAPYSRLQAPGRLSSR